MAKDKDGMAQRFRSLDSEYGIFRAAKFGIAGAVGFLVAELIIIVGLYVLYGNANVPSEIYSSPTLLGLNILAFVVGVTVGFFINERITVRNEGAQKSRDALKITYRLLKYQGVYGLGNAITIGVQLALLEMFSVSPAIGNIIGAIIAFPVSYLFSMRIVWRISSGRSRSEHRATNQNGRAEPARSSDMKTQARM